MLKRKDRIIISAIELLHDEGVNGVTSKNLAKKQNVTEPALYRQFKSKQEILDSILNEYASYDTRIQETIKQSSLKGKEAVIFYVTRYAEFYQNYPEITTVMFSMDLYYYNEQTKAFMEKIVEERIAFLEEIINLNKDYFDALNRFTCRELASLINGTIYSQVYEWRMLNKSYTLDERLIHLVSKLL